MTVSISQDHPKPHPLAKAGDPRRLGHALLISLAATVGGGAAQAEAGSASSATLAPIVVTGTRSETSVKDSPVSVTVIGPEDLDRRSTSNVADLLRDAPGITLEESSIPGMKRLSIRGEDARRSAVLIDGQEITDHTSYGPPLLIDPGLIERIELVRGPQSVLYGSKAIGGVVNIITKKGGDRPVQGEVNGTYLSATDGYSTSATLRGAAQGFEYRLFASNSEEEDRETPSGTPPTSATENRSASAYLAYDWGQHKLAASIDRYDLTSQSSTPPGTIGTMFSEFQLDLPQRDLQKVALFYDAEDLFPIIPKVHLDLYRQTIDRTFYQDVAGLDVTSMPPGRFDYHHSDSDKQTTLGGTFQIDWAPHPDHDLITGLQLTHDSLDKSMQRTGTTTPMFPPIPTPVDTLIDTDATMRTTSFYGQDRWSLTPDLDLIGGLRQYWVRSELESSSDPALTPGTSDDSQLIGSAAIVYKGLPNTTLRAGYAQGYVHPTILHLHTGSIFGSGFTVRPNPNLEAETSDSYEIGLRYGKGGLEIDAAAFYTKAKNYIDSVDCAGAPSVGCPSPELTYINVDEATTFGLEGSIHYAIPDTGFDPYATATLMRRKYSFETYDTYQTGTPALKARVGLRYDHPVGETGLIYSDFYVRGATSADERGTRGTTRAGGWTTVNLSLGATAGADQQYRIGLDLLNLTDTSYQTTPEESEQPGRSVTLSLTASF